MAADTDTPLEFASGILQQAARTLREGGGAIRQRLREVHDRLLARLDQPGDLPADLREQLQAIRDALTRVPGRDAAGSVAHTTAALRDDEANELAGKIVGLSEEVSRRREAQEAKRPGATG